MPPKKESHLEIVCILFIRVKLSRIIIAVMLYKSLSVYVHVRESVRVCVYVIVCNPAIVWLKLAWQIFNVSLFRFQCGAIM